MIKTKKKSNEFIKAFARFSSAFADLNWTRESGYLLYDIAEAVESSRVFKEIEIRLDELGVSTVLEWNGTGNSLDAISRDFWVLYGVFAENEQFVAREVESNAIIFRIVSGSSANVFPHGHLMVIRVVGRKVQKIAQSYLKLFEKK